MARFWIATECVGSDRLRAYSGFELADACMGTLRRLDGPSRMGFIDFDHIFKFLSYFKYHIHVF